MTCGLVKSSIPQLGQWQALSLLNWGSIEVSGSQKKVAGEKGGVACKEGGVIVEIWKGSRPEPAQLYGLERWIPPEISKCACAWSAGKMQTLLLLLAWFAGGWQGDGVQQDGLGRLEGWLSLLGAGPRQQAGPAA